MTSSITATVTLNDAVTVRPTYKSKRKDESIRPHQMETKRTRERKRRVNVRDGDGEKTPRGGGRAVTEEEVREFSAILHRIRDGCGEANAKEGVGRWRPMFRMEDFGEVADEVASGGRAMRIDLNVEPERESREGG